MRAMTPDDLYAIIWVSECDISPDGSRVAFVATKMDRETDAYKSAIWIVDTVGGAPRQFTAGAKRDTGPKWSPDGKWLAFLSERGEEKPQLCVIPADGGESRLLTKLPFGAAAPAWRPDSKAIAFSAKTGAPPDPDPKKAKPYRRISTLKSKLNGEGFTYDRRPHIFIVDIDGGDPRQITDGDWNDSQPAWSADGTQIAFVSARHDERDFDTVSDIFVVGSEGGDAHCVTTTSGGCYAPSWSPDGSSVAYLFRADRIGNAVPFLCDASGGNPRPFDASFDRQTGGSIAGSLIAPQWLDRESILAIAEDRGTVNPFRAAPGHPAQWLSRDRRVATACSVDAAGSTAAIVASTIASPAEVALLDLATGAERILTTLNADWLRDVSSQSAEHFALATEKGIELDCWFMKPAGFEDGRTYPILLNVHGGPFTQYSESFFDEFQVYAGAGYGVVFCNPRGSSGQSTAFGQAVIGNLGGPDFEDVMAAFDAALERMPWADQTRMGVMGGSYGGFMTSWIIGHDRRFKAAISERAVNDWYSMQGASDIGGTFNEAYLGENAFIQGDLAAVLRQSPLSYAKEIDTPVLILHSEDDWRCPMVQAELLFTVLKQLRKDVEFVRFPDESHELTRSGRPSHRKDRYEVVLEYLGRKL